jgi:hypothetical protein
MVRSEGNIISMKMDKTLQDLINQYAIFMRRNRSEAMRELLLEALYVKTKHVQFKRLSEYITTRNPFTFRTECEHCASKEHLIIYYIDGDINNFKSENVITLCKNCYNEFELFRLKQNVKERFIEWFFKD